MFDKVKSIPEDERPAYDRDLFDDLGRRRRLRRRGRDPMTGEPLVAEENHVVHDG